MRIFVCASFFYFFYFQEATSTDWVCIICSQQVMTLSWREVKHLFRCVWKKQKVYFLLTKCFLPLLVKQTLNKAEKKSKMFSLLSSEVSGRHMTNVAHLCVLCRTRLVLLAAVSSGWLRVRPVTEISMSPTPAHGCVLFAGNFPHQI